MFDRSLLNSNLDSLKLCNVRPTYRLQSSYLIDRYSLYLPQKEWLEFYAHHGMPHIGIVKLYDNLQHQS